MEYKEKLTDPRWQKKRLEIMTRDNWKCQHCGKSHMQLEVHHTDYWAGKQPWEYPGEMLLTICRECHGAEDIRFKHESYLLKSFNLQGFIAMDLLALSTLLNTNQKFAEHIKKTVRKYAQNH